MLREPLTFTRSIGLLEPYAFMEAKGRKPRINRRCGLYRLDGDREGVPCERLCRR